MDVPRYVGKDLMQEMVGAQKDGSTQQDKEHQK